ncbi:hypothetical protein BJ742DRAFT_783974 [Cladochytrium replicatum]|nr:hypothetical protein BJ742DRAFT_783974 [Cladochytrium replicatum]
MVATDELLRRLLAVERNVEIRNRRGAFHGAPPATAQPNPRRFELHVRCGAPILGHGMVENRLGPSSMLGVQTFAVDTFFDDDGAPDIYFLFPRLEPRLDDLPSLTQWRDDDPEMLVCLVKDLKRAFSLFHRDQILELGIERFSFDLSSFEHRKDVDVLCLENVSNRSSKEIWFSIPVKTPVHKVEESQANVEIRFFLDGSHIVSVQSRVNLPKEFGQGEAFKMPSFDPSNTMIEYVMEVETALEDAWDLLHTKSEYRRMLIISLLSEFNKNLLEYDSDGYSYASFLFELPNNESQGSPSMGGGKSTKGPGPNAIINVFLDSVFPDRTPTIMLIASGHLSPEDPGSFVPNAVPLQFEYKRPFRVPAAGSGMDYAAREAAVEWCADLVGRLRYSVHEQLRAFTTNVAVTNHRSR